MREYSMIAKQLACRIWFNDNTQNSKVNVLVVNEILKIFIDLQLIYNILLISGVQQSDSVTHTHTDIDSFPLQVIMRY